nr:protein EXECUTER 1, chloroplastic-like [Ipomoea batatas]
MQGRREQTSASYVIIAWGFRPSHTSSSSPIAAPLPGYIRVDYEGATRLKVAIAAAATNDTVGKVKSHFNVEILESVREVADCIWEHSV